MHGRAATRRAADIRECRRVRSRLLRIVFQGMREALCEVPKHWLVGAWRRQCRPNQTLRLVTDHFHFSEFASSLHLQEHHSSTMEMEVPAQQKEIVPWHTWVTSFFMMDRRMSSFCIVTFMSPTERPDLNGRHPLLVRIEGPLYES